jgi:hypothetical protein
VSSQPPPPTPGTGLVEAPPPPPSHDAEPRRPRPWRTVAVVIVGLFVLALAAIMYLAVLGQAERDEEGVISETGDLTVLKLQVGDCFDEPGAPSPNETAEISSVDATPCSEPHDFEVFHTFELTTVELPSEADLTSEAGDRCLEAFEPYVGSSYEESELDIYFMWPSPESWGAGDRTVLCSLVKMDGTKLVDSAAGSGL